MTQAVSAATRNERHSALFDGVDLEALARKLPTPFHAYSASAIRRRIVALDASLAGLDAQICFAVKANSNLAILQIMAQAGLGADIVSAGELERALGGGGVQADVGEADGAGGLDGRVEGTGGPGDRASGVRAPSARLDIQ